MKFRHHLLVCLLAFCLGGCGATVHESLKVDPLKKNIVGADKTVVILPFADYSQADNLESAYRRNLFVSENVADQFVRLGFHLPVQEDIYKFLADQNIINVTSYDRNKTVSIEYELDNDWSSNMKRTLKRYIKDTQNNNKNIEGDTSLVHGLSPQEIVKIGRHFSADYIVRGRIIQYRDRLDPSWAPWKKGIIPFFFGTDEQFWIGQTTTEVYDDLNSSDFDDKDRIELGAIPQAVVQIRMWVQEAYNGNIVWSNRNDVKVSPRSFWADYEYDALFEKAIEQGITTLMNDFAYIVYNVPLPDEKKNVKKRQ